MGRPDIDEVLEDEVVEDDGIRFVRTADDRKTAMTGLCFASDALLRVD
jgi:hypothetical protein